MKRAVVALLVSVLAGCAEVRYEYVGVRHVPEAPSFVVFPLFETSEQYLYAGVIEAALLGNGVKVLARPQRKEITAKTKTQMETAAESGPAGVPEAGQPRASSHSAKQDVEVSQRFLDMGTQADYVVITHCHPLLEQGRVSFINANVRIIRRETNELVGSFATLPARERESLQGALRALSMIPQERPQPTGAAEQPKK
ncbi:MAG: hypothetical protein HY900_00780 [Deltaproteobacteria bacterium]|nr:hypothetical protein [Deltaproteobacteria bacterium]